MKVNFYPKKNKYQNIRTNGFASKLEAEVYKILKMRERAGEISDIKKQQRVDLTCGISWRVDFSFFDKATKKRTYAEAKGMAGERYRLCRKLWKGGHGPGKLEIWKGSYKSPKLAEIVHSNPSQLIEYPEGFDPKNGLSYIEKSKKRGKIS